MFMLKKKRDIQTSDFMVGICILKYGLFIKLIFMNTSEHGNIISKNHIKIDT